MKSAVKTVLIGSLFAACFCPGASFASAPADTVASAASADSVATGSAIDAAQERAGVQPPEAELRGAQAVFDSSREIRTAASAAARSVLEARWGRGRVVVGPGSGGPDEIRICLGRFGCWNIKIEIKISSAD